MSRNYAYQVVCALTALLIVAGSARGQEPLGSEWTYQGQLMLLGEPLNDTADFEFTLWDADSGGNMIGSVWPVNNVTVVDGLFTVEVDFGVVAFNGEKRWLEIDVRSPAGGGDFTTLSPRQPLTANPYSLQTRGIFVDDLHNVGIGKTDPATALDVNGTVTSTTFVGDGSGLTNLPGDNLGDHTATQALDLNSFDLNNGGTVTATAFVGDGSGLTGISGGDPSYGSSAGSPDDAVFVDDSGGVGIGTNGPTEQLDVEGNIHASGTIASGSSITIDGTAGSENIASSASLDLQTAAGRALRLEDNATSPNLIGGFSGNSVTAGAIGATIAGGGANAQTNRVTDDYGVIGGGYNNQAGDAAGTTSDKRFATVGGGIANTANGYYATVGGGKDNTASGYCATVGGGGDNMASGADATVSGGADNTASGDDATVGGGFSNTASTWAATVGGGDSNTASAWGATVPGGCSNQAGGEYSFAAGNRAKANHAGAFVWADSEGIDFASTAADQFLIRASGGVGIGEPSPSAMLDVVGPTELNGDVTINSNLTVDTDTLFVDGTTGNVGIGTSAPEADLHIYNGVLRISRSSQAPSIDLVDDADQDMFRIMHSRSDDALRIRNAALDDLMAIEKTGNVGIGMATPAYPLDVAGEVRSTVGFRFPDDTVQTSAAIPADTVQYLNLGPGAFVAADSNLRIIQSWYTGVWMYSGDLVAPLQLPAGARILSITVHVRDEVDANLRFRILRKINENPSSYETGVDFNTSGNSGYFSVTSEGGPTIDDDRAHYFLVEPVNGGWPGDQSLAVNNIHVEWTMAPE